MARGRWVIWAEWADGFQALVTDRGKTFTRAQAQDLLDDPTVQRLYHDARLFLGRPPELEDEP